MPGAARACHLEPRRLPQHAAHTSTVFRAFACCCTAIRVHPLLSSRFWVQDALSFILKAKLTSKYAMCASEHTPPPPVSNSPQTKFIAIRHKPKSTRACPSPNRAGNHQNKGRTHGIEQQPLQNKVFCIQRGGIPALSIFDFDSRIHCIFIFHTLRALYFHISYHMHYIFIFQV